MLLKTIFFCSQLLHYSYLQSIDFLGIQHLWQSMNAATPDNPSLSAHSVAVECNTTNYSTVELLRNHLVMVASLFFCLQSAVRNKSCWGQQSSQKSGS